MARKNDKGKEKSKGKDKKSLPPDFLHEIWGVVFLAAGTLILVSVLSSFVNASDNVLGVYLGTNLSSGLRYLFGPIAVFIVPLAVLSVGVQRLRGKPLRLRTYLFWGLITIEGCALLAIDNLATIRSEGFTDNCIGNIIAYLLNYAFGAHKFGPYFLFSTALLLTLLIGLRIPVKAVIRALIPFLKGVGAWFAGLVRELGKHQEPAEEPPLIVPPTDPDDTAEEKSGRKSRKPKAADEQPSVPAALGLAASAGDGAEGSGEADDPLRQQLAEFRAKKALPITIANPEELAFAEAFQEGEKETELDEVQEAALANALKEMESPAEKEGRRKKGRKRVEEEPAAEQSEVETTTEGAGEEVAEGEPEAQGAEVTASDTPEDYYKLPSAEPIAPKMPEKPYVVPSMDILPEPPPYSAFIDRDAIERNSQTLEKTLLSFGVEGKVVSVSPGPVITRYEIELAPGVKVSRVVSIQDDIAIAVGGQKIRILPHIPGKAAIGIELPNDDRQIVYFKHILQSDAFAKAKAKLGVVVGRGTSGAPVVTDVSKMPHLLIAGQTGAGKSVCINTFICSLLMSKTPQELRFIMVDPKKVELSYFEGIPHLLAPVVTEPKEAVTALRWGVKEVERRYRIFARAGARNIESFNERMAAGKLPDGILAEVGRRPLPMIVIVVDELADLMITAPRDVETCIQRIAQLARAVGIHLIVATQRPSVDVITGRIKANLASRIAFRTIQATDSRTILEHVGAEKLLGQGDMLYLRSGAPDIERFHGAFTSEEDVEAVVEAIRRQAFETEQIERFVDEDEAGKGEEGRGGEGGDGERDELFAEAARVIVSIGQGSTSLLQRRMKIGYARAGRIMDELEKAGLVGPQEGGKMREVLVKPLELEEMLRQLGC